MSALDDLRAAMTAYDTTAKHNMRDTLDQAYPVVDAARAYLAALPSTEEGAGWNFDMEAAPKDDVLTVKSPDLVDIDFNPDGIAEGFWRDEDGWVGARWNNDQDCWDAVPVEPVCWRPKPHGPPLPAPPTEVGR